MGRWLLRWTGNLCLALSVLGLASVAYLTIGPETPPPWIEDAPFLINGIPPPAVAKTAPATAPEALPGRRAITHLTVPRIDLSADVVPAALIERSGALTWDVPAFKAGHAEATAGAGAPGNAILLGHVTSVHSGNVFQDLDQVQIGDTVQVFADSDRFDYTVVDVARVPRTTTAQLLDSGAVPSVSLITCTGMWLPTIWDFTQRLVVRAELAEPRGESR
jgi:LPXTG-site transpeptidase (sortase) family protein